MARTRQVDGAVSILFFCTLLAIGRVVMLGVFTLIQASERVSSTRASPRVTVLFFAFNEELGYAPSIRCQWRLRQPRSLGDRDDGSTDRLRGGCCRAEKDARITLVTKQKRAVAAKAANAGLAVATGEIVAAVDADTIVVKGAIAAMSGTFRSEDHGGVRNVEVGNVHLVADALSARSNMSPAKTSTGAFCLLNTSPPVPGALGAWRRRGLSSSPAATYPETLTEDADPP